MKSGDKAPYCFWLKPDKEDVLLVVRPHRLPRRPSPICGLLHLSPENPSLSLFMRKTSEYHTSTTVTIAHIYKVKLISSHESGAFNECVLSLSLRNSQKNALIHGCSYAVAHSLILFAFATSFMFGAWLIQHGRLTVEGVFLWVRTLSYLHFIG